VASLDCSSDFPTENLYSRAVHSHEDEELRIFETSEAAHRMTQYRLSEDLNLRKQLLESVNSSVTSRSAFSRPRIRVSVSHNINGVEFHGKP
jgi:hypothetical protein